MRSAVLNRAGEMVSTAGKGEANHAGLSPLIRQLKQPASRGEADVIAKIVAQHRVSGAYTPVRIFTKSVDARLVDGIAQLTGKPIGPNSVLRADYMIDRGHVFIANITHDGVRAPVVSCWLTVTARPDQRFNAWLKLRLTTNRI